MNRTSFVSRLASTAALSLLALTASAATIPGMVDTGAGLAAGQQDTNYALTVLSGTATSNGFGYVADGAAYPVGIWMSDTSTSHWLTPSANAGQSYDPAANGSYAWTLSFDLTGYDVSTASFTGRWSSDNGSAVYLNGQLIASNTAERAFESWSSLGTVNSGFLSGVNTLEFVVTNLALASGNPTGLRVELASSVAAVSAVPEPGSCALMLAGLTSVGFVARRRTKRI